jgi:hypothetical protein
MLHKGDTAMKRKLSWLVLVAALTAPAAMALTQGGGGGKTGEHQCCPCCCHETCPK